MKQQLQLQDVGRVFFFLNYISVHWEAGRVFRWESFVFTVTVSVSVLSDWAIFKMIKSGDDRQQNDASEYKIREGKTTSFPSLL